ncbi:MAG: ABC transporter ATP-binding protein [Dethiobacteria bacterium]|nr:ABC transporter ATP-binding protein [Bacillota bacterium]HOP69422.1 ABC transporter ATP-binding protein [Bacillota bacterium]HPT34372.1 ABC transporter ATP-binding protein [Bacillota bacterium]HQD06633.1 ABC transporter ATP-binding protein [Bacillota bacterium]
MEYAIQTERLSKSFGGRRVLRDINLQVPKGSIFGFIGPNGAGKTTTIRLLLGLIKPDAGSSSVLGLDSFQQSIEIRKRVGYLSEHNQFYPWMRVEELIKFNAGFFPTWDHGRAEQLLQMFDLHPGARIKELSKGMRTQLGLVISLAHNPELLILDEPTSGLDPVWRRQFLQIMAREAASRETTVFFSSHILSDVERVADWLAIIVEGRIKTVRPMDDIKYNERKIRVVFQGEAPESLLGTAGIKSIERQGSGYLITVEDNFDEIYKALKNTPHFALEVVEQDLESIFLDYAGKEDMDA